MIRMRLSRRSLAESRGPPRPAGGPPRGGPDLENRPWEFPRENWSLSWENFIGRAALTGSLVDDASVDVASHRRWQTADCLCEGAEEVAMALLRPDRIKGDSIVRAGHGRCALYVDSRSSSSLSAGVPSPPRPGVSGKARARRRKNSIELHRELCETLIIPLFAKETSSLTPHHTTKHLEYPHIPPTKAHLYPLQIH